MKKKEYCSIGIMSGTSLDGLDVSLIKTDGMNKIKVLFDDYYKFSQSFKSNIKKVINKFNKFDNNIILESKEFVNLNEKFTGYVYKKILSFINKNSINISDIDVIGIHGNTILHQPKNRLSIQLGNSETLSKRLKICVISNFRINDIIKGGEGAPLAPIYHQSQFSVPNKNIIVVNIGGISNFSLLKGNKELLASDIGPGNKLLDQFCNLNFKKKFDKNGEIASKGKIIFELINIWKKKTFLRKKYPVSFDNFFFNVNDFNNLKNINSKDFLRTLTYFSAFLIFNITKKVNLKVDKWIFSGGGVANNILMQDLKEFLGEKNVLTTKNYGLDPFFIESQAFAYISVRTLKSLPSSFPETTGCKRSSISGEIVNF